MLTKVTSSFWLKVILSFFVLMKMRKEFSL